MLGHERSEFDKVEMVEGRRLVSMLLMDILMGDPRLRDCSGQEAKLERTHL